MSKNVSCLKALEKVLLVLATKCSKLKRKGITTHSTTRGRLDWLTDSEIVRPKYREAVKKRRLKRKGNLNAECPLQRERWKYSLTARQANITERASERENKKQQ